MPEDLLCSRRSRRCSERVSFNPATVHGLHQLFWYQKGWQSEDMRGLWQVEHGNHTWSFPYPKSGGLIGWDILSKIYHDLRPGQRILASPNGASLSGEDSVLNRLWEIWVHGDAIWAGRSASHLSKTDERVVWWPSTLKHRRTTILQLREVLKRLAEAGLQIKMEKCQFVMTSCDSLGHRIGHGKLQPSEAKVSAIQDFKTPKTKKDLRAFLGLAGYYRRFVPHYADIAAPLTDLTGKLYPDKLQWEEQHQAAFSVLKEKLKKDTIVPRL